MKSNYLENQLIQNPQYILGGNDDDGGPISDPKGGAKKKKKTFWEWVKGIFTKN